jgi:hypothetical protein
MVTSVAALRGVPVIAKVFGHLLIQCGLKHGLQRLQQHIRPGQGNSLATGELLDRSHLPGAGDRCCCSGSSSAGLLGGGLTVSSVSVIATLPVPQGGRANYTVCAMYDSSLALASRRRPTRTPAHCGGALRSAHEPRSGGQRRKLAAGQAFTLAVCGWRSRLQVRLVAVVALTEQISNARTGGFNRLIKGLIASAASIGT